MIERPLKIIRIIVSFALENAQITKKLQFAINFFNLRLI